MLRGALELEVAVFSNLPELIEPTPARTFERERLHEQIDHVSRFHEPSLERASFLVLAIDSRVNVGCFSERFCQLTKRFRFGVPPFARAEIESCRAWHVAHARFSPIVQQRKSQHLFQ